MDNHRTINPVSPGIGEWPFFFRGGDGSDGTSPGQNQSWNSSRKLGNQHLKTAMWPVMWAQSWSTFRWVNIFSSARLWQFSNFGPTDVTPHESDETNTLYTIHSMELGISSVRMWADSMGSQASRRSDWGSQKGGNSNQQIGDKCARVNQEYTNYKRHYIDMPKRG